MKTAGLRFVLGVLISTAYCLLPTAYSQTFDRTVIDANFPGAYQVEVADVNGDKKPDIIAVGGSTCAWYENPTWKKRIVTGPKQTPGIISSATTDLDGDGKAEIAIAYEFAMNTPTTGKLLSAVPGRGLDDPWKFMPIAKIGSIHRLRWGDINGDKRPDLVVAPIFGPKSKPPTYDDPARLVFFDEREDFKAGKTIRWHPGRRGRRWLDPQRRLVSFPAEIIGGQPPWPAGAIPAVSAVLVITRQRESNATLHS